jgi:hypothetical protein
MSDKKKEPKAAKKPKRKKAALYPPPPMLREPVTSVYGAKTYVSTATIEEAPKEEVAYSHRNKWLRQLAEVQFVTSQEFISLAELAKDPKFKHLKPTTLTHWSAEDCWFAKRQEYFERLKKQLEQKIGTALVRAQYDQLAEMDALAEDIKNKLRKGTIPVRSFEGLVKALLGVEEFRRADRIRLAADIIPESLDSQPLAENQIVPDLSDEEARKLATEIMKLRQQKIRGKLSTEGDDGGETVD